MFRGITLQSFRPGWYCFRKLAEYGVGEYGFKHWAQWVFWPSLSSAERAQWVPLSPLFVCQSELTEFFAELTRFAVKLSKAQWVLFSETGPSKQYSARFLCFLGKGQQNSEAHKRVLCKRVLWESVTSPQKAATKGEKGRENREVLNGVGADGVGVKFPIFPVIAVNCPLF